MMLLSKALRPSLLDCAAGNRAAGWRGAFLTLLVFAGLLGGCQERSAPVEVVESFMAAVEAFDVDRAQSLVCEDARAKVRKSLESFETVTESGEAFALEFDALDYREQSNDGQVAVVHVSGSLTISFLGRQEIQAIDEEHRVIKKGGRWLICDL